MYEIEIKSLLGNKDTAISLKNKLRDLYGDLACTSKNNQLNHYFTEGNLSILHKNIISHISDDKKELFEKNIKYGNSHSVRTRQLDDKVILVLKSSVDDTTSANGISRMEFECEFPEMTLEELDNILVESGFSYQAKWSREREEYKCDDLNICIDKNAGYGHVAEFEIVVDDVSEIESAKNKIFELMNRVGVEELPQDRLERMFEYYNNNWKKYYGTDNVFVIE